jgi:hypothetical protein
MTPLKIGVLIKKTSKNHFDGAKRDNFAKKNTQNGN